MVSQIKVDSVLESSSGNGVTIDGVLIKDNAIASSYISGLTSGLESAQQFRLTTTVSADTTPLTAYEVPDTSNQANLGSLVSVSSGVFSFSETGFYEVEFTGYFYKPNTTGYSNANIQSTLDDGSNWTTIAHIGHEAPSGYTAEFNSNRVIVDITDVSQQKIRVIYDLGSGTVQLRGDTGKNASNIVFKKLGDT